MRLVFTRVIPLEQEPSSHPLWRLAESFGATCSGTLDAATTHVIAGASGTEKVGGRRAGVRDAVPSSSTCEAIGSAVCFATYAREGRCCNDCNWRHGEHASADRNNSTLRLPAPCAQVLTARQMGKWVVTPAWLECSCILWKRANEDRFLVPL